MANADRPLPEVSLPTLLRVARGVYSATIRRELADAGYDDIPDSGLFVIGAIARVRSGAPMSRLIRGLGVSKQVAGQLVDTLVLRGYATREVDPEDRRRLTIAASERGRGAAQIIRAAIERIEADLSARVGTDAIAQTRATLQALIEGGSRHPKPAPSD